MAELYVVMVLVCWNDLILQGYGSCPPDTLVLHASPGTRHYLTSPNYPEPYPNGITCMWEMRAPSSDHRVHIEITDFRLEVCPFDAIAIHDGTSSESRRLLRVCGDENPVHVTSTGQSLFIMFETDAFVQEKGFEITYTSFVVGEQCPPSWNYFENNCYKIRNETLTWDDAQKHCTYDASNLVVIDNEDENSFIVDMLLWGSWPYWIGLHKSRDEFRWINDSVAVFDKINFVSWHDRQLGIHSNSGNVCAILDPLQAEEWYVSDCYDYMYHFICEKNTAGNTKVIYFTDSGVVQDGHNINQQIITYMSGIMGPAIYVIVLVCVFVYCYVYPSSRRMYCKCCRTYVPTSTSDPDNTELESTAVAVVNLSRDSNHDNFQTIQTCQPPSVASTVSGTPIDMIPLSDINPAITENSHGGETVTVSGNPAADSLNIPLDILPSYLEVVRDNSPCHSPREERRPSSDDDTDLPPETPPPPYEQIASFRQLQM